MFSINIYLRLAGIALFLGGGIILSFFVSFWYALPLILAGLFLLVGYLLLGTVQSAAMMLQTQDFDGAEKRLNLTLTPRLLYSATKAYYYILKGGIAQYRNQNDEAEVWLKKAETIKLPSDNERAMVQLQLANIAATKDRWNQAQLYLRNIKQLKITEESIKEQVKMFEKAMANRGQIKSARTMMGGKGGGIPVNPGGKRRRPKMR